MTRILSVIVQIKDAKINHGFELFLSGKKFAMTFEEYLTSRKIDSPVFRQAEPQRWQEWKQIFTQTHPESFTAQKKFLLNPIRRKYRLAEPEKTDVSPQKTVETGTPVSKPKIAMKPVIKKTES
jgi:hypothetical protein